MEKTRERTGNCNQMAALRIQTYQSLQPPSDQSVFAVVFVTVSSAK